MKRPILKDDRDLIGFFGKPGCGKTVGAQKAALEFERMIIIEHRKAGEYLGVPFWEFDQLVDHVATHDTFCVRWLGSVEDKNLEMVEHVFRLAFKKTKTAVLVEEAARVEFEGKYKDAVLYGRSPEQISGILNSQRPGMLDIDLRGNLSEVYAFCNTEPSAVDWFKPILGKRAAELPNLKPMEYLRWDFQSGQITEGRLEA